MRTSRRLGVVACTAALGLATAAGATANAVDVKTTGVSATLKGTTLSVTNSTDKDLICFGIVGDKAVIDMGYKLVLEKRLQMTDQEMLLFQAALVKGDLVTSSGDVAAKKSADLTNPSGTAKSANWLVTCSDPQDDSENKDMYVARSASGPLGAIASGSLGSLNLPSNLFSGSGS